MNTFFHARLTCVGLGIMAGSTMAHAQAPAPSAAQSPAQPSAQSSAQSPAQSPASPQSQAQSQPQTQPQAQAQASSAITPGMRVTDTAGAAVGSVVSVDGDFVTIRTDRHDARLPRTAFTPNQGVLLFGMTQQQLDTAIERDLAAASAKLAAGATVTGSQGATVGTIETIDDQFATLKLTSGKRVRIPRAGLGAGPQGAVIGMTAAALEAMATAAAPKQD